MASATSFTSARMLAVEAASVVSGSVDDDGNLILETHGGSEINAGNIRGPEGVVPDISYTHVQGTPESMWTIVHNLGFNPAVSVVDSSGTLVEGDVEYTTANTITLRFNGGFSGTAYLS